MIMNLSNLKIAVIVKGQQRFYEYGSNLFTKHVIEKFPQHEFKTFCSTWKSVALPMSDSAYENMPKNLCQHIMSLDEAIQNCKVWSPAGFNIFRESDLLDVVERIFYEKNYANEVAHWPALFDHYDSDIGYCRNPFDELQTTSEKISMHYKLGQIYTTGKGIELVSNYESEYNWTPDIVWITRPDHFGSYSNTFFKYLARNIDNMPIDSILTNHMIVRNGMPMIDDFNFFMSYNTALQTLDNIEDRIVEMFNDNISKAMMIGSGSHLQHVLWCLLWKDKIFKELDNTIFYSNVLRPINNIDALVTTACDNPSLENVKILYEQIANSYNYPSYDGPVEKDQLLEFYEKLKTN